MAFQTKLLEWYEQHHRQLPFRESCDPYKIWISEIMLQQTQMETVLPYYKRFMATFPTVFELAQASEHEVMNLWQGLGYYARARNLMKCAKVLAADYNGEFPKDYKAALKLPGIGPYTAGAVLSIAFNQRIPAVDGNVMRVLSRLFNMQADISVPKNKRLFVKKAEETMTENAGDFNQALMELGALVCLPKNPKCGSCPLMENCIACERSLQSRLPVKKKKIKNKKLHVAVGIVRNGNTILMTQTSENLLKGLWGFPIAEGETPMKAKENLWLSLKDKIKLEKKILKEIGKDSHVFTHKTWKMTLYEVVVHDKRRVKCLQEEINGYPKPEEETIWIEPDAMNRYPIATAFKKLLIQLK